MLIDLTTLPVTISLEEGRDSLIVRSWEAWGVNGRVCRAQQNKAIRVEELTPGAKLVQGEITCLETRIPLPYVEPPYVCLACRGSGCRRCPSQVKLYEEPWEVATGCKDILVGNAMTWRAALHIQYHPRNQGLLLIGVGKAGEGIPFLRIATKALSRDPVLGIEYPLRRHTKAIATAETPPPTFWDRLTDD